jgi:hypothetical protein
MSDIIERLDVLKSLLSDVDFLEGKGLSNEVNIRIFCYDPKDEMAVRHFTEQIQLETNCNLKIFNLYQVFLDICDSKKITKNIPATEQKKGSKYLLGQLKKLANTNAFIDKMKYEPHENGDVIFITGVGEAFPFIRVHALLDAMQPYFADVPIIVLYPGTFDGRNVKLFDKFNPNPYYRAFNVVGM